MRPASSHSRDHFGMSPPLTGLSSMATRNLLREAVVDWRSRGGGEVAFESVGGIDALRRIEAGEALDIAVLAADAIERLVAAGRIVADSTKPLARSKVAIAVAAGAPRPAIDSIEALRDSVLAARSIGYSTGPSGVALQRMFERWGILDAVRTRLVVAPPGVAVGDLVARGDAALGFQQRSELMHVEGIDLIGAMPTGAEIDTIFSGGVLAASRRPVAARAFLDFVRSPAANAARQRNGMDSP